MNWTPEDALRFHNWECAIMWWRVGKRYGSEVSPPPKPAGYDLWKQGPDPMKLESISIAECKGGSLVDPAWTSTTIPIPLDVPTLEQPDLL